MEFFHQLVDIAGDAAIEGELTDFVHPIAVVCNTSMKDVVAVVAVVVVPAAVDEKRSSCIENLGTGDRKDLTVGYDIAVAVVVVVDDVVVVVLDVADVFSALQNFVADSNVVAECYNKNKG